MPSEPKTTESIYEQARRKEIEKHTADRPWHADDIESALLAAGIEPRYLIEYLDWLKDTPR